MGAMRFNVKVSLLWFVLFFLIFLFINIPKSPDLKSKTALQDIIEGFDIPMVPDSRWNTISTSPSKQIPSHSLRETFGPKTVSLAGENGRGIIFVGEEQNKAEKYLAKYNVNVFASDLISLTRKVPDSRHPGNLSYPVAGLPDVTVIIPFHDEWLSLLLRTVYSVINRTPPSLLREIILVDDASTLESLQGSLDTYINESFPKDLVRIIRMPERRGLIQARLVGWRAAKGETLVFLDSHMEMNIDWLQPLLVEIQKNKKTIAMSVLDYIDAKTLQYNVRPDYLIRYGFNWKLIFFEYFFRTDQIGPLFHSPRKGVTMVGAAFAVNKQYFADIGAYDEGMKIWGGENLELSWRVWLCGGQLLHVPCSHMGHIMRVQPYTFPGGRHEIEMYNYKRAVDVWMGPLKKYVYHNYPEMEGLDAGNISGRIALKKSLQCKSFKWYIQTLWPELLLYDVGVVAWGSARNSYTNSCLDNYSNIYPGELHLHRCHYGQNAQGFSLTTEGHLRSTLALVVFDGTKAGEKPVLQYYGAGVANIWTHKPHSYILHDKSKLCLDAVNGFPTMEECSDEKLSQKWIFSYYV